MISFFSIITNNTKDYVLISFIYVPISLAINLFTNIKINVGKHTQVTEFVTKEMMSLKYVPSGVECKYSLRN